MKSLLRNCSRVLLVLAAGFLFTLAPAARAADDSIGANVATITVPAKLTAADVEAAVQQSLIARKWLVRDKSAGSIIAHYERGKNTATLTIRYDDKKVEIYAVGKARGGGLPMRWIESLKSDINIYLGRKLLNK